MENACTVYHDGWAADILAYSLSMVDLQRAQDYHVMLAAALGNNVEVREKFSLIRENSDQCT